MECLQEWGVWNEMAEIINLPIKDYLNRCDLILGIDGNIPARCFGYPDECHICEVTRYLEKLKSEELKLTQQSKNYS